MAAREPQQAAAAAAAAGPPSKSLGAPSVIQEDWYKAYKAKDAPPSLPEVKLDTLEGTEEQQALAKALTAMALLEEAVDDLFLVIDAATADAVEAVAGQAAQYSESKASDESFKFVFTGVNTKATKATGVMTTLASRAALITTACKDAISAVNYEVDKAKRMVHDRPKKLQRYITACLQQCRKRLEARAIGAATGAVPAVPAAAGALPVAKKKKRSASEETVIVISDEETERALEFSEGSGEGSPGNWFPSKTRSAADWAMRTPTASPPRSPHSFPRSPPYGPSLATWQSGDDPGSASWEDLAGLMEEEEDEEDGVVVGTFRPGTPYAERRRNRQEEEYSSRDLLHPKKKAEAKASFSSGYNGSYTGYTGTGYYGHTGTSYGMNAGYKAYAGGGQGSDYGAGHGAGHVAERETKGADYEDDSGPNFWGNASL